MKFVTSAPESGQLCAKFHKAVRHEFNWTFNRLRVKSIQFSSQFL